MFWTATLQTEQFSCGDEYTIADIAIHLWYGALAMSMPYEPGEILNVDSYKNVQRWTNTL